MRKTKRRNQGVQMELHAHPGDTQVMNGAIRFSLRFQLDSSRDGTPDLSEILRGFSHVFIWTWSE